MATLRFGTQGFSYPGWIGSFFPPRSKQEHYLPFYAQVPGRTRFNSGNGRSSAFSKDLTKPRRLRRLQRADEQQGQNHDPATRQEHQKRHQTVLQEAALLLDTPRLVDGARDRTEHAQ